MKGFGSDDPKIAAYWDETLQPEDDVLREVRERCAKAGLPEIQVGRFDGRHLEVIARSIVARKAVEIGTLGGYSGVCIARGLAAGGVLHTFEIDPDHAKVAEESFRRAGVADRVRLHVADAKTGLAAIEREAPFDLVFIDADKPPYPDYFEWSAKHLRVGGVLLADNVSRRSVSDPGDWNEPSVKGIREFNRRITTDPRFRTTVLPTQEGLSFSVKVR